MNCELALFPGQEQVDPHNSALNTASYGSPSYCVTGGLDLVVQDHAMQSDLSAQLSSSTDEVASISCASGTTFCVVADDSGGAYALSGETLSARTQVAPNGFDAVSCPTSSFCMAIDATGNTFAYSSGFWGPAVRLGSLSAQTTDLQMSCVSAQFCVAASRDRQQRELLHLQRRHLERRFGIGVDRRGGERAVVHLEQLLRCRGHIG